MCRPQLRQHRYAYYVFRRGFVLYSTLFRTAQASQMHRDYTVPSYPHPTMQETLSSLKFANQVNQDELEARAEVSGTPQKASAKVRTPSSRLYKTPTSQARKTPRVNRTPKGTPRSYRTPKGTPRSCKRRAGKTPVASAGDSSKRMKR